MKASTAIFAGLSAQISEISRFSGIPGVSWGVIDNGSIIHQASHGFCDVENKIPCNANSTFVLGSLSKAFTSALLSQLVEDGKLQWNDPVREILVDFQRTASDLSAHATVADLLSHRTGLSSSDSLWAGSDNVPLLNHSDSVKILSYLPQQQAFRASFVYNNWAYDVLGHIIEKVSGSSYSSFLHDRLLGPLNMSSTYFTEGSAQAENEAKAYAALSDASPVRIGPAIEGDRVLMGPAGGVRSSVSDLLVFYDALMDAATDQTELGLQLNSTPRDRPFALSQLSEMWTGWNILPMPLLREHSYGFGWLRAQLPSVMAPSRGIPEFSPLVGVGVPSLLAIWHSGSIPGYRTHATLFPETRQAIVVLTNSAPLNDGTRLISDLLIEALLGNLDNAADYVRIARITAAMGATRTEGIHKQLLDGRTRTDPSKPLDTYIGRYFNAVQVFFIDIFLRDNHLYLSFMGREKDTFELAPYGDDSFFWFLTHDEAARLARDSGYGPEFYILKFGATDVDSNSIDTLWWKHEPSLSGFGEVFRRDLDDQKTVTYEDNSEL
ncbi:unnamed protein product [Clonostachys byssicola]|uniref:Beta-lactamase-related domain-containing protein n=1 Tax=Clonostachys byssicola TaxID=160290 RepID=A0A9N9UHG4_9HYPO|nr:unnamed protein product [Clonostachys byssicola]